MNTSPSSPAAANLSLSDAACIRAGTACVAFSAAQNASQAALPWASLFKYGHWTTYYYLSVVGLLFVYSILRIDSPEVLKAPLVESVARKVRAFHRWIFYRRLPASPLRKSLDLPSSFGMLALLLTTVIYFAVVAFLPRPYYREHLGYGSPPLAVRTGLMSIACLPILVALAGKVNIVTILTGISHERLNLFHRWTAWMTFGMALVHTIPFILAAYNDQGWGGLEREKHEFSAGGLISNNQSSGVPPLATLFIMCLVSLPSIRENFHELFWFSHVLLGMTYLGLLFWHATAGDSWVYLWVTVLLWLASWSARMFWKTQQLGLRNEWFVGYSTVVKALPGGITRVEISVPQSFQWKNGQHVFVRFSQLEPLSSHPFTIASIYSPTNLDGNEVVLLARSHSGTTLKLRNLASRRSKDGEDLAISRVWLDGPYGGLSRTSSLNFNTLLLLSGGTGISATLPWLLSSVAAATQSSIPLRRVVLVWAIRHLDALLWIENDLQYIATRQNLLDLDVIIRVHVTGTINVPLEPVCHMQTKAPSPTLQQPFNFNTKLGNLSHKKKKVFQASTITQKSSIPSLVTEIHGRPNMSQLVEDFALSGERTLVIGCGPDEFQADAAYAVASAQRRAWRQQHTEIAMHLESYRW